MENGVNGSFATTCPSNLGYGGMGTRLDGLGMGLGGLGDGNGTHSVLNIPRRAVNVNPIAIMLFIFTCTNIVL